MAAHLQARRRLAGSVLLTAAIFLAAGAPAGAATAPSAITGAVSAVTASGATVAGTVNPEGLATTWTIEYGTTTSYGSQTSSQSAGSGSADVQVSGTLSGLQPGTTYHYRLDATSSAGSSEGADGLFTTAAAPGAVTGPATVLGATSATLTGTVAPNGQATSYVFEYGTTTSYGTTTASVSAGAGTAAVKVSASLSGLQSGATYHYRLVATSPAGSTDGADVSFALRPLPTVATGSASSLSPTSTKLTGSVNPNGQATTWYFQYGTTTAYGAETAATSAGSGTAAQTVTVTLTGLHAATGYHFRLVANNASGTSYGSDVSFGTSLPPVVLTGSAEGATATGVTLTGTVDPKGVATSFSFQYGTTTAYGSTTASTSAGSGSGAKAVSATLSKLLPATSYHYRLVATSAAGTTDGGDVTFTTPAAVTLSAESTEAVYGQHLGLSGTVAGSQSGVKVTVLAEPYGQHSFAAVAVVVSGSGGSWSYQARPAIETSYEAETSVGTSGVIAVGVRPLITIHLITGSRFLIKAVAARGFPRRTVQIQRLLGQGGWSTLLRVRLNGSSSAILAGTSLPYGTTTLRIAMSVNQAGRGYLGGFSRVLAVIRHAPAG